MKRVIAISAFAAMFVLLSYTSSSAQVVEKVKEGVDKAKDVTVSTATKTKVVVTDAFDKSADKTVATATVSASKSQKFGSNVVNVTESVAGHAYEGGKYYTVKTWDGTKWVSNRVWYKTKKAAGDKPDQK